MPRIPADFLSSPVHLDQIKSCHSFYLYGVIRHQSMSSHNQLERILAFADTLLPIISTPTP